MDAAAAREIPSALVAMLVAGWAALFFVPLALASVYDLPISDRSTGV